MIENAPIGMGVYTTRLDELEELSEEVMERADSYMEESGLRSIKLGKVGKQLLTYVGDSKIQLEGGEFISDIPVRYADRDLSLGDNYGSQVMIATPENIKKIYRLPEEKDPTREEAVSRFCRDLERALDDLEEGEVESSLEGAYISNSRSA